MKQINWRSSENNTKSTSQRREYTA